MRPWRSSSGPWAAVLMNALASDIRLVKWGVPPDRTVEEDRKV